MMNQSLTLTAPVALTPTAVTTLKPSDVNSIDGDSDELLLVPAEVSKNPTPTAKAIEPPPTLKNANLNDVVSRAAKIKHCSRGQDAS
jgi:hypothetical protein